MSTKAKKNPIFRTRMSEVNIYVQNDKAIERKSAKKKTEKDELKGKKIMS